MTVPLLFGTLTAGASAPLRRESAEAPLSELSLTFVPLSVVAEWTRCSDTADFVARYFAHDYRDREVAASVLSTVVNELVENAAKFSSDKTVPARITVREYPERLTIATANVVTPAQGAAFGEVVTRIVDGDPEAMFAEQIAHPPETGGAGIGLIMLRKDYGARIGVRLTRMAERADAAVVEVEVTIENREVEPQ